MSKTMLAIKKANSKGEATKPGRLEHGAFLEEVCKVKVTEHELYDGKAKGDCKFWCFEGDYRPKMKVIEDKKGVKHEVEDIPHLETAEDVEEFVRDLCRDGLFLSYSHKVRFPEMDSPVDMFALCDKLEEFVPRSSALVARVAPTKKKAKKAKKKTTLAEFQAFLDAGE